MAAMKYKRVLLKLSGEMLSGSKEMGFDFDVVRRIAQSIKKCVDAGVEMGIVVGGGNFWRGRNNVKLDRIRADQMGMLATVMKSLALGDFLEQEGVPVRVMTALDMSAIAEPYTRNRAFHHMEQGRVLIFGCGTGNPYFSTDSAAALRAAEINADIIFKATTVDGVYNKDPKKYPDAVRYSELTFTDVLNDQLQVMDMTAASMCRDTMKPILVFSLQDPDNLDRACMGEVDGTIVHS